MKKKNNTIPEKLTRWQRRLADSNHAYSDDVAKMDERERIYNGDNSLLPLVPGDTMRNGQPKKTSHVATSCLRTSKARFPSSIPSPKVTPRRKKDEHLAAWIEHFLRNEIDRLPFETMNDMAERTVPIQGGVGFWWSGTTAGEPTTPWARWM